jgi:CheY-like chemotaxis protein
MSELNPLDVLFPGARRPILAALYGEPSRWWSLPELAGRAGLSPATLRRHLAHFRDAGLISERADGERDWFQPNPASPVYAEMQAIMTKLTSQTRAAETILIIEDQEATAQITRILLESWGYRVFEAHSGAEALEIFKKDGDAIQLVLTDVIMPGMSGPQIAGELVRQRPGLRVAYMSGYPSDTLNQLDAAFLAKPFNPHSLARMIRRELDRRANSRQMKGS